MVEAHSGTLGGGMHLRGCLQTINSKKKKKKKFKKIKDGFSLIITCQLILYTFSICLIKKIRTDHTRQNTKPMKKMKLTSSLCDRCTTVGTNLICSNVFVLTYKVDDDSFRS